jgi:hypothetical protein
MDYVMHRTPSVGKITKDILAINPDLGVNDIVSLLRSCTYRKGVEGSDFGALEAVDEAMALELARATVRGKILRA